MSEVLRRFRLRLGEFWVEDLGSLGEFLLGPFAASTSLLLDDLGSSARVSAAGRLGKQILKTGFRGILPIMFFAAALFVGARAISERAGELGRPILESFVVLVLLRDGLPLGIALFVATRQGASLTAKYTFRDSARQDENLRALTPYVIAAGFSSMVFYVVQAFGLVGGYLSSGPLEAAVNLSTLDALMSSALQVGVLVGALKAGLFGMIVVWVALALGWYGGERAQPGDRRSRGEGHYYIWEATVISLTLCIGFAVLFYWGLEELG